MSKKHIQPARLIAAGCKCLIHFIEILKIVSKISFSDLILIYHKSQQLNAFSPIALSGIAKYVKFIRFIEPSNAASPIVNSWTLPGIVKSASFVQ